MIENKVIWLKSKDEEYLKEWIMASILDGNYNPLEYKSKDDHEMYFVDFCDYIIKTYKHDGYNQIERLKNIIREILVDFRLESYSSLWRSKTRACDLLSSVLILCFHLKISKISENIVFLMESRILQGLKNSYEEDLHSCLYRIILSIPIPTELNTKIEEICIRDIGNKDYSFIAYRCLWQIDISNGVKYIKQLYDAYLKDKYAFDFHEKVSIFIDEKNIFGQTNILKNKLEKEEIENFVYYLLNDYFYDICLDKDKFVDFLYINKFISDDIIFDFNSDDNSVEIIGGVSVLSIDRCRISSSFLKKIGDYIYNTKIINTFILN
jgi:hypothetical protein